MRAPPPSPPRTCPPSSPASPSWRSPASRSLWLWGRNVRYAERHACRPTRRRCRRRSAAGSVAGMRRALPAIGLFSLAPVIGEMLLGATSIDAIGLLPFMALLYGGGSLLIRETVRRSGRGWWSILLLGAAYALLEEGLLDQ